MLSLLNPFRSSPVSALGIVTGCLTSATLALAMFPGVGAIAGDIGAALPGSSRMIEIEQRDAADNVRCRTFGDAASGQANCASLNVFGDAPVVTPGGSRTNTAVFTNSGSVAASSFAVRAGACSEQRAAPDVPGGRATDLCDRFSVHLAAAGVTIFDGSAAEFGRAGAIDILGRTGSTLESGRSVTVVLTLTLSRDVDNRYQGLSIVEPIAWTFGE